MLLDYKCSCQKLLEPSFIKRTARLRADKVLLHLVLDGSGPASGALRSDMIKAIGCPKRAESP